MPLDQHDTSPPGAFADPLVSHITSQESLTQAVYARRAEYTESRKIRIKICTWNVGNYNCARDIAAWVTEGRGIDNAFSKLALSSNVSSQPSAVESVQDQESRQRILTENEPTVPKHETPLGPNGHDVDIYVVGLQEIVDINSPTEALRPYTDPAPSNRYKDSLQNGLPEGYVLIAEQQLVGLLLLVYISPALAADVQSTVTTSVGTGIMGYMGNKGAVTGHVIIGESTRLVFVNCHLAAGSDKASLERRNWDARTILARTRFTQIVDPSGIPTLGESIGQEDFVFWFGDLNYRLESIPGTDVRRILSLHVQNQYDLKMSLNRIKAHSFQSPDSNNQPQQQASEASFDHEEIVPDDQADRLPDYLDPVSLQTTLNSILPHDELTQQIKAKRAFHQGWREGPIKFLPTYKYDSGSLGFFDSSEKSRAPSWCDRILYRSKADYSAYTNRLENQEAQKQNDHHKVDNYTPQATNVMFDYDTDEDGENKPGIPAIPTFEKGEIQREDNSLLLEYYTSHQRVLSSDHKPLTASFTLTYQAVIPEKKRAVEYSVRRELDKQQNELRPSIAIAFDRIPKKADPDRNASVTPENVIDFGHVRYQKEQTISAMVANVGQIPAVLRLIKRPNMALGDQSPTPPWLHVTFDRAADQSDKKSKVKDQSPSYTLQPGDACGVDFTVLVTSKDLATDFDNGDKHLDDILILRVENGRDYFLPVVGKWHTSSSSTWDKMKEFPANELRNLEQQKPRGSSQVEF